MYRRVSALHIPEIYRSGCRQGGRFCSEAGVAEVDGDETGLECKPGFLVGEVAFGADQDYDVLAVMFAEDFLDAPAGDVFVFEAVGDEAEG